MRNAKGLILAAMLCIGAGSRAEEPFRRIVIPMEEHGYQHFESQVIRSAEELEKLFDSSKDGWNKREEFEKNLKDVKFDFTKEALVLLRHTEGSGSTKVTFEEPELVGATLKCKVSRSEPEIGTADMAYYAFVLAVKKEKVKEVKFTSHGKTVTLKTE